jgi:hypothetical protein
MPPSPRDFNRCRLFIPAARRCGKAGGWRLPGSVLELSGADLSFSLRALKKCR